MEEEEDQHSSKTDLAHAKSDTKAYGTEDAGNDCPQRERDEE
jgi:hypothetical protein